MITIVSIDVSGEYPKGTSGIAYGNTPETANFHSIVAQNYKDPLSYYIAHKIALIKFYEGLLKPVKMYVVVEKYTIYAQKIKAHTYNNMKTSQLIGYLKMLCKEQNWIYLEQSASQVKTRWSNDILTRKGYLKKIHNRNTINNQNVNRHEIDAYRHFVHAYKFKINK